DAPEALALADSFLASEHVIRIAAGAFGPSFSTPEILALERRLLGAAESLRDAGRATVPAALAAAAVERRAAISSEQARMGHTLPEGGEGIILVLGRPGTGKTYAIGAAVEGWAAAGIAVRGAAPTRAAAAQLEGTTGIKTVSVAAMLVELDQRAANPD